MRHAEFFGQLASFRVDVNTNNFIRPGKACALHHIQADAAQTENHNIVAGFDLGGVNNRTDTGGNATTNVAHLVKRRVRANLRHRYFGQNRVIGKSGSAM